MRCEQWTDDAGQHFDRYVMRDALGPAPEPCVENPRPIRYALRNAFEETADVMRFITALASYTCRGRTSIVVRTHHHLRCRR